MHESYTYLIRVRGRVEEEDLNAMSPVQARVVRMDTAATLFTIQADQAGLIGLMRHLHGRGFVLLAISRERETNTSRRENV